MSDANVDGFEVGQKVRYRVRVDARSSYVATGIITSIFPLERAVEIDHSVSKFTDHIAHDSSI